MLRKCGELQHWPHCALLGGPNRRIRLRTPVAQRRERIIVTLVLGRWWGVFPRHIGLGQIVTVEEMKRWGIPGRGKTVSGYRTT